MNKLAQRKPNRQARQLAGVAASEYAAKVKRYLLNRLQRRPQEIDDLAQEVYLRLLRIPEDTLIRQPQAFIYRVAAGVIGDFCAQERQQDHVICDSESVEEIGDQSLHYDPVYTLQLRGELNSALQTLPPMMKDVLMLYQRDGYSCAETALRLGLTVGTVKQYLFEARARLRLKLWPLRQEKS
jgi:RNA polymerase sigma-70 factor (ECF subfamily)